MSFENPNTLAWLPLLLILLLGLGWVGWWAKRQLAGLFRVNLGRLRLKQLEKLLLAAILITLLVGAWALPRLDSVLYRPTEKTGEVALLVDVSASMAARQSPDDPSRLDRAKPILQEIVDRMQELGGVRVSLHGFTTMARSHVPWVGKDDYPYLRVSITRVLDINSIPGQGSGIGQPILDVANKFSPEQKVKLIVMLSDGEPFTGVSRGMQGGERNLIERAVQAARVQGIRVITVGIGEREGAKIPLPNADGAFSGKYAQLHGADLSFYLMEEGLRDVSSRTGGRYFGENDRQGLVDYIVDNLATVPAGVAAQRTRTYRSIAQWFMLAAAPLWVVFARRHLL